MIRLKILCLFLLIGHSCRVSTVQELTKEDLCYMTFFANVDRIIDGDTIVVLYKGKFIRIRLTHIDAPENRRANPSSKIATQTLRTLCADSKVTIQSEDYDRYGRLLAEIINSEGVVVNKEMVRLGMAVHYKRYSSDSTYASLEREAQRNKVGVWETNEFIASK